MKKYLVATVLVGVFYTALSADMPVADQKVINQTNRIDQGVSSGALNAQETNRLQKQQDNIDRHQERITSDGKVTTQERIGLKKHQQKAGKTIYRKKHNNK